VSAFGDTRRATFSFQFLPRVSGSFRYSLLDVYDRSFDVQYLVTDETRTRPAIAIGLRDFLGTGLYSSEYIVATKTVTPNVRVTGGLGWGRLGSANGFTNPLGVIDDRFETRPDASRTGTGGTLLSGQFFRGDAAFFGGVEWRLGNDWTVMAEYSSDAYERETRLTGFERDSDFNFGAKWAPSDSFQLGAYYMYGTEVGLSATVILDPKTRETVGGLDAAPFPVVVRSDDMVAAASWDTPAIANASVSALGTVIAEDGFRLIGAEITGNTMRVRYVNSRYRAESQGVGRLSRILTAVAPPHVETFILEPTQRGIPLSAVTVQRSDMEELENAPNAAALAYDRTTFGDAASAAPAYAFDDPTPAFLWGISPYVELTLFDGDEPLRGDLGLEASFQYEIRPNIILAGAYRQRVVGNRDEIGAISPSTLPDVRRTGQRYGAENGGGIETLFLSWYGRPGTDLYSRFSAGYLERGFAGVSSEVLWKPVDSQLALGAELNYTLARDFDYLAGDWGATLSVDREFTNGWKVGAYATLTNVDFDDFGEGSFDKGILIEIPFDSFLGTPTRDTASTALSSLERDGGARLRVDGRLYDVVGWRRCRPDQRPY